MSHDPPSVPELVRAVRELLESDIAPALDGAKAYDVRVAIHVLGIVERELRAGAPSDDLAALADALRTRKKSYEDPVVLAELRADAEARLAVANPKYRHARRTPD